MNFIKIIVKLEYTLLITLIRVIHHILIWMSSMLKKKVSKGCVCSRRAGQECRQVDILIHVQKKGGQCVCVQSKKPPGVHDFYTLNKSPSFDIMIVPHGEFNYTRERQRKIDKKDRQEDIKKDIIYSKIILQHLMIIIYH